MRNRLRAVAACLFLAAGALRAGDLRVVGTEEFRRAAASGEALVIDARVEALYAAGHVPGALNLPRYRVVIGPDEVAARLPRERPLVVYCDGPLCQDAELEARALAGMGYRVAVFPGGMKEWRARGLPEERAAVPAGED